MIPAATRGRRNGSVVAPDTAPRTPQAPMEPLPELAQVFHRLNNQLGVILANAELLETRLADETQRARAGLVVAGALDAISAVHDLRRMLSVQGPIR